MPFLSRARTRIGPSAPIKVLKLSSDGVPSGDGSSLCSSYSLAAAARILRCRPGVRLCYGVAMADNCIARHFCLASPSTARSCSPAVSVSPTCKVAMVQNGRSVHNIGSISRPRPWSPSAGAGGAGQARSGRTRCRPGRRGFPKKAKPITLHGADSHVRHPSLQGRRVRSRRRDGVSVSTTTSKNRRVSGATIRCCSSPARAGGTASFATNLLHAVVERDERRRLRGLSAQTCLAAGRHVGHSVRRARARRASSWQGL